MAFLTANIDYVSAARQVREDDGLTEFFNALADAYGEQPRLLSEDNDLTPEAKRLLERLGKESEHA